MAKNNGTKIKILSDGVTITYLKDVAMNINGAMIDVTNKDSGGWKEILPGLKDATMSGSGFVDWAATFPASTIFTKISAGTSCAVIFYDSTSGNKSYTATAYYSKFNLKAGTEDAFEFDFEIMITGTVTQTATT